MELTNDGFLLDNHARVVLVEHIGSTLVGFAGNGEIRVENAVARVDLEGDLVGGHVKPARNPSQSHSTLEINHRLDSRVGAPDREDGFPAVGPVVNPGVVEPDAALKESSMRSSSNSVFDAPVPQLPRAAVALMLRPRDLGLRKSRGVPSTEFNLPVGISRPFVATQREASAWTMWLLRS